MEDTRKSLDRLRNEALEAIYISERTLLGEEKDEVLLNLVQNDLISLHPFCKAMHTPREKLLCLFDDIKKRVINSDQSTLKFVSVLVTALISFISMSYMLSRQKYMWGITIILLATLISLGIIRLAEHRERKIIESAVNLCGKIWKHNFNVVEGLKQSHGGGDTGSYSLLIVIISLIIIVTITIVAFGIFVCKITFSLAEEPVKI